jgi:apolipoprotein N-acyltransferase
MTALLVGAVAGVGLAAVLLGVPWALLAATAAALAVTELAGHPPSLGTVGGLLAAAALGEAVAAFAARRRERLAVGEALALGGGLLLLGLLFGPLAGAADFGLALGGRGRALLLRAGRSLLVYVALRAVRVLVALAIDVYLLFHVGGA